MRSTEAARSRAGSRRRQSGQSLVEAVVASLVVGIAVAAGVGTLDAAVQGARQVAVQAWAECMQRGEVEAVAAAPWSGSGSYAAPGYVNVSVTAPWPSPTAQKITITITNPITGGEIAAVPHVTIYKAQVLSPSGPPIDPAAIATGCQNLLGGS